MKTIKDVEGKIQENVSRPLRELGIVPEGYQCTVRLHGKSKDKKRTAAFEKSWKPDTDSIIIEFERTSEPPRVSSQPLDQNLLETPSNSMHKASPSTTDPMSDLIRALDHAESRPGYEFVALKWFRDAALLSEGLSWASADSARRDVLRSAIDRRLVLTSKVPNPKSPQFPVTAIRLNRLMPEVRAILGNPVGAMSDFSPAPIRGESLSETLLRDRR
jgi:hypothetical protein